MRIKLLLWVTFLMVGVTSCAQTGGGEKGTVVIISTPMGDMKARLYDETPQHRDNFLKLAGEGFYDGVLFHRVIRDFMIQTGDPDSKTAVQGARLGNGGPGYTIPAEFVPGLFHKKGALAAARLGDQMNPEKASSGSQFYIVEGKVWRNGELDTLENRMNATTRQTIMRSVFTPFQEELNKYRQEKNQQAFNERVAILQDRAEIHLHGSTTPGLHHHRRISPPRRRIYRIRGNHRRTGDHRKDHSLGDRCRRPPPERHRH